MSRGEPCAEHCLLLRREPSGEADERVALLGEARGLFWVTARGARRSKKRFMGVLEPFTRGIFRTARVGRGEVLEDVEPASRWDRIPRDLGRYYVACYACEAVARLLRVGHPAPELFRVLAALLDDLQESEETAHMLWRALFEAALLEHQGIFPELDPELAEAETLVYDLDADHWGLPALGERPSPTRIELPRRAWTNFLELRELPLAEARARAPDLAGLRPVNRLTAYLLRYNLQLELNSARLLNAFQKKALELGAGSSPASEEGLRD